MSAALAAAMLVSVVAVPVFADGTNTSNAIKYYYDKDSAGYKTEGSVQGADGSDTKLTTKGETVVKYEVHSSYEWSIPSEIDFGSDKGANKSVYIDWNNPTNRVEVTKNVIPKEKKLVIKAVGSGDNGEFIIKSEDGTSNTSLEYKIYASDDKNKMPLSDDMVLKGNDIVLELDAGTGTGITYLTFELKTTEENRTAEYAGSYKGTATFTASVVDA